MYNKLVDNFKTLVSVSTGGSFATWLAEKLTGAPGIDIQFFSNIDLSTARSSLIDIYSNLGKGKSAVLATAAGYLLTFKDIYDNFNYGFATDIAIQELLDLHANSSANLASYYVVAKCDMAHLIKLGKVKVGKDGSVTKKDESAAYRLSYKMYIMRCLKEDPKALDGEAENANILETMMQFNFLNLLDYINN